jgi:hypothetical protein
VGGACSACACSAAHAWASGAGALPSLQPCPPRTRRAHAPPQFDPRPLAEINAERDAHRTPEDLAARALRDEGQSVYGDQPIELDPYDDADAWTPPFAVAPGQPLPSVAEVRAAQEARAAQRHEQLLSGPHARDEPLPELSSDELLYGRLLGNDLYKGGVKAALARRARQAQGSAGGGAATQAVASLTANAAAGAAAGAAALLDIAAEEAAAAAGGGDSSSSSSGGRAAGGRTRLGGGGGSGGGGDDGIGGVAAADSIIAAEERWPWPTEAEVAAEAAERRAAPRIWVLIGGDGPARQQALRSGANVVAKLQRCCDLQVRRGWRRRVLCAARGLALGQEGGLCAHASCTPSCTRAQPPPPPPRVRHQHAANVRLSGRRLPAAAAGRGPG